MSDASEESDHFDGLVQGQDDSESASGASDSRPNYGSDDAESDSDGQGHMSHARFDDSGASDYSDSDGEGHLSNPLFDLAAEEADETGSDDEGHSGGDDDDGLDGYVNRIERSESPQLHFFPQFKRLPIELRYRIWELFCPEILAKGRVYPFQPKLAWIRDAGVYRSATGLRPHVHLGMMTESSRAVLAVHHESRQFALSAFPDSFPFRWDIIDPITGRSPKSSTLRFNKENDIILVDCAGQLDQHYYPLESESISQVRNIAFSSSASISELCPMSSFAMLTHWENPGTIYIALASSDVRESRICSIDWCGEKDHHHYRAEARELQPGLGEDLEYHWVWPNLGKHPEYKEYWFEKGKTDYTYHDWVGEILDPDPDAPDIGGYGGRFSRKIVATKFLPLIQPLIEFIGRDDERLFNKLVRVADGDEPASELDDSESDEPDEYESEGIDDSEIEESEECSEDEDDLIVRNDNSESGSDGQESTFAGFSPIQEPSSPTQSSAPSHPVVLDLDHNDGGARFSSLEQDEEESQTVRGSDSEEDNVQPAPEVRKRRRVLDSDEDEPEPAPKVGKRKRVLDSDEDESEPAPKFSKRKRVLDSDDDEEVETDDEAPRKRTRTSKGSRAIVIDDEDDDEDEDGEEEYNHLNRPDSEEEEDESEDEQVEETESRPLTLMERLELHRRNNPTPGGSDEEDKGEDPDMEEMGQDDYDARNYGGFEDDDEGVDDEEDLDILQGIPEDDIDYDNLECEVGDYDDGYDYWNQ